MWSAFKLNDFFHQDSWYKVYRNNRQIKILHLYIYIYIYIVAERIPNYCLARESFWPLRFRSHIFDQWGWFIPFSSDDFPGQYKRWWKRALPLFLTYFPSRTDRSPLPHLSSRPPSTWGEHIQFMDRCFLGNHSFIICSSLLDQMIPKASNWNFNSYSDISNSFLLLFVRLAVQGDFVSSWH